MLQKRRSFYYKHRFLPVTFLVLLLAVFVPAALLAQADDDGAPAVDVEPAAGSGALSYSEFRIFWENDAIYGETDFYYTNGLRVEFATVEDERLMREDFLYDLAIPTSLQNAGSLAESGWSLGQDIYTPTDLTVSDISYGDRPYAGYLYLGRFYSVASPDAYHRFELDLGVIGPASGADKTQTFIHERLTSSEYPQGWGWQIPNYPTVQFEYDYSNRLFHTQVADLAGNFGLRAGNAFTDASFGFTLRLGYLGPANKGYIPLESNPGYVDSSGGGFGMYLFARPEATAVGYNGTLQGRPGSDRYVERGTDPLTDYTSYSVLQNSINPAAEDLTYLGYFSLVQDRDTLTPLGRFLIFNDTVGSNVNNAGMQFLVYNTLFDGGRTIDPDVRDLVAASLLAGAENYDPVRLWFISKTLGRKNGEPLDPLAKFIAYRIMTNNSAMTLNDLVSYTIYSTLFQKSRPGQTYTVEPRRFYGTLRVGAVFHWGDFSLVTAVAVRSAEFFQGGYLPEEQRWFTLQATTRF